MCPWDFSVAAKTCRSDGLRTDYYRGSVHPSISICCDVNAAKSAAGKRSSIPDQFGECRELSIVSRPGVGVAGIWMRRFGLHWQSRSGIGGGDAPCGGSGGGARDG